MTEKCVQIIKPTISQMIDKSKLRVGAYCRVSTNSEDQINSFSAQLRYYSEYITSNNNMEFVDIYADEGITGTCISKRNEFKRMLKDAEDGKLDRILVKSVSRFARNSLECIETIRKLTSHGVSVYFENDNIDTKTMNSELILYVKSAFAQTESFSNSNRVSTAIRMRMENGDFSTYTAPYGYRLDENMQLQIIPEQAETVKNIFKLYLSGNGAGKIAEILNSEQVDNKFGKWTTSGIQYILSNEKYIGNSLLQKTYTPQVFPLRNRPNRGELAKYYVENTHAPIISQNDFNNVQLRLHRNKSEQQQTDSKKYFFSKKIECAECGWAYKRKVQNNVVYWVCSRKGNSGQSCGGSNIKESDIKAAFVHTYNKMNVFNKQILENVINRLMNVRKLTAIGNNDVHDIDLEIANLCRLECMYTDFYNNKKIDVVSYNERVNELKYKVSELRKKRLKTIRVDSDEHKIEDIRILKEITDEYPKKIFEFEPELFEQIVEKVIVGNDNTISFRLKGGLVLKNRFTEMNYICH